MSFGRVENGMIVEFSLSERQVRELFPNMALPANLIACPLLTDAGIVWVDELPLPVYDTMMQSLQEDVPQCVSGQWQKGWIVSDLDTATIAELRTQHLTVALDLLKRMISDYINGVAVSMDYDSKESLASYATSKVPRFQRDATMFIEWRDTVWEYCFTVQNDVIAGIRPLPSLDGLIAELPVCRV